MKLTKAQDREWLRLVRGLDADMDTLINAGLVECTTRITLSGGSLGIRDEADLTPKGQALLDGAALSQEGE